MTQSITLQRLAQLVQTLSSEAVELSRDAQGKIDSDREAGLKLIGQSRGMFDASKRLLDLLNEAAA